MAVNNFEDGRRVAALPSSVSGMERLLLHTLLLHRNAQAGECFPTFATLAREMGASVRTVKYAVSRLAGAGLLAVGKRRTHDGKGNTYALTLSAVSANIAPTDGGTEGAIRDRRWCNSRPQKVQSTTADGATVAHEQINNISLTENETRTPQAASVSPPSINDAITATIDEVAQTLGDRTPSRKEWRKFCENHGILEFKRIAGEVANTPNVENYGAYLNTRLKSYEPPNAGEDAAARERREPAYRRDGIRRGTFATQTKNKRGLD